MRDWSMITALIGARLLRGDRAQLREGERRRRRGRGGPRRGRAPPRRGGGGRAGTWLPPSANVTPKRCHAAIRPVAGVEQRIAGGFAVDEHPAAHAEVQARGPRRSTTSTRMSLPRRRACVSDCPRRARRARAGGVSPRLRNHASGACTVAIVTVERTRVDAARAPISTSRISGTCAPSVVRHARAAKGGTSRWRACAAAPGW